MSQVSVEAIYREISNLTINEKKIILSKLISEIPIYDKNNKQFNLYDIKGVGKEIWEDIDAQDYVDKERASWE